MSPYEILGHTADVRLKVFAGSIEELFREALLGMMGILKEKKEKPEGKCLKSVKKIYIESSDQTSLLVDFLNEALYNAYANKEICVWAEFETLSENKLSAKIFCCKIKGGFDRDIKAATYHEAEIKKIGNNFEVTLIFDI